MDIVKLKSQIKHKELNNFYIFTGVEIGLMNMYIDKMSDKVTRAEEVSHVWQTLTTKSLMGQAGVCVVRDDKQFIKYEKVWTDLQSKIKHGILILIYSNLDKRSVFYKTFSDNIVEFDKMTEQQLLPLARRLLPKGTSDDIILSLIKYCGVDYGRLVNECDKLTRMNTPITLDLISTVVNFDQQLLDVFQLANDMISRSIKEALDKLQQLMQQAESSMSILGVLYTTFRNAILVVGNPNGGHGVNGYAVHNIKSRLAYDPPELLQILRIIQDHEQGVKTGKYDEKFAVWDTIIRILCV
jgi:DNA polymerase III, delta subunit